MKLFKTHTAIFLQSEELFFTIDEDWDKLINRDQLFQYLKDYTKKNNPKNIDLKHVERYGIMAPVGKQELWAAGVTYLRSREARMEEAKDTGSADCYQKVYEAERPELFFKALPQRIAAHNEPVFIRKDSKWNVPEPELTLYINSKGSVQAYTIGNDMSSRDIEGENPLYLPQAKVYERSAALGPCLYIPGNIISDQTLITLQIRRHNKEVFKDSIKIDRIKRSFNELASYLFRECDFEHGCFLMTGTGIVPPSDFTLHIEDEVIISIEGIGTLVNKVTLNK
jgi:2-dehydro-3-deoxy-D-arabinonate dehydratase